MYVSSTTPPHIMEDIQAARRGSLHSPIFFLFEPVFCLSPPLRSLVPGYLLAQIRESCITALTVRPRRFFSPFSPNAEPGPRLANEKLKQRPRHPLQKRFLKLHRTYSISFNSSNVGKLFWCYILKDCIEVRRNKKKVVRHFHVVVIKRRQRNVQKSVMHVQSYCFVYLKFLLFCRSRSSLLKLPTVSVLRRLMSSLNLTRHLVAQCMSIIGAVEIGENPEPPSSSYS